MVYFALLLSGRVKTHAMNLTKLPSLKTPVTQARMEIDHFIYMARTLVCLPRVSIKIIMLGRSMDGGGKLNIEIYKRC
jgi:hypothetical protein